MAKSKSPLTSANFNADSASSNKLASDGDSFALRISESFSGFKGHILKTN